MSDALFVINLGVWRWFAVRMKNMSPQFAALGQFLFRFAVAFVVDVRCPANAINILFRL